ncbi:protein asteroid [Anopheles bellator]|uniref:protein asteroid n=1 Tax=Anopheles bellator TaxID=139047 RepID=UPI00264879E4|nr:protein asteroid [Anopheles bellator]
MGVRGLTTFIGTNAEVYLKPHELHDTALVIDGDNLCVQLFKKSTLKCSSFGGNYDSYYRVVFDFFEMLKACNVVPYVLLDGGYEARKIPTVRERMIGKIHGIRSLSLEAARISFPLMMREVFIDALRAAEVRFMRCSFEADDEVAILARKLNCPVMSYDSDFYIHNVRYIPYVTLSHKIFRKVSDQKGENFQIATVDRTKLGTRHEVKFVAQCGDDTAILGDGTVTYDYLDCCLYTIDNLTGPNERLNQEMIPLFAVLLGNDYIERKVLTRFYSSIKCGRVNRKINHQQRRIKVILRWLQRHTLQSAIRAIVNQIRQKNKQRIFRQMLTAMRGYNCEECVSYEYFGFSDEKTVDEAQLESEIEQNLNDSLAEEVEEQLVVNETASDDEPEDVNLTNNDTASDDEPEDGNLSNNDEENFDSEANRHSNVASESSETEETAPQEELGCRRRRYTDAEWPTWFRELYRAAYVPRFFADLYHSQLYVNSPQVEDFNKPDSNTVSYPILRMIFALLSSAHPKPTPTSFRYMSRKVRVASVHYIPFESIQLPKGLAFDPESQTKNIIIMKHLFEECGIAKCTELFREIQSLPPNLTLYFLSIIYWAKNCDAANVAHVLALLVCVLQLQIIDRFLKNKNRDEKLFLKQHQTYLEEQKRKGPKPTIVGKTSNEKDNKASFTKTFFNQLANEVARGELMLVYETLIRCFAPDQKLNRKNTSIDRATLHCLAEFQSVCFNFYSLVPLLDFPFDNVRMHELYNGCFVYSLYEMIKSRPDPYDYVLTTKLLRFSPALSEALKRMMELVVRYVPELKDRKRSVRGKAKSAAASGRNVGDKRSKKSQTPRQGNDCAIPDNQSESDNGDFVDVNNKFTQLLLAN